MHSIAAMQLTRTHWVVACKTLLSDRMAGASIISIARPLDSSRGLTCDHKVPVAGSENDDEQRSPARMSFQRMTLNLY